MNFPVPLTDVAFSVPIEPRGWARARHRGKRYFNDEHMEVFKAAIGNYAMVAMRGRKPFDGALSLLVVSVRSVPKSWSEKKRAFALVGTIRPTSVPDVDNYLKAVCDALNGIAWIDDAQVVDGQSIKHYGERPQVIVAVKAL